MKKVLLVALVGVIASVSSGANAADASGAYFGFAIGQSKFNVDDGGLTAISRSEKPTSGKIFGGFDFTPNLAIESGYAALGTAKNRYTLNQIIVDPQVKVDAFYVAAKVTAPIAEAFSIYGKLGATRNHATGLAASASGTVTTVYSASTNKTGILAAVGADYLVSKNVAVGLEFTSYGKIDDGNNKVSALSLNASFKF